MDFGAFDTETVNRPGRGEAVILIKDEGEIYLAPDTWDEIFNFLSDRPRLCWNMDFDMRAIFHPRFIPSEIIERLAVLGRAKWRTYYFEYIPGKFFRAMKKGKGGIILYDLKQFFGLSLDAAAKKFLPTERKIEIPRSWYSQIDKCLLDSRHELIIKYAAQDAILVMRLRDILFNSLGNAGIKLARPTSCAAIARAMFGKTLKRIKPPEMVNKYFSRAMFGGRIETSRLGYVGPCSLYDIHSAYPSVMWKMLSPDGDLNRTTEYTKEASYGAYRIKAAIPTNYHYGPLAVRRASKVYYPVGNIRTWCCRPALQSLIRHKIPYEIIEGWEIFSSGEELFPELNDCYLSRKNPALSLPMKLGPNSLYGVMAQRIDKYFENDFGRFVGNKKVRHFQTFGPFCNMPLACHVTEAIRMRLWEQLHHAGKKAIFAATDSILYEGHDSGPRPLGDRLGDWGHEGNYQSAVILGCGRYALYGLDPERPVEYHIRGFPIRPESLAKIRRCKRGYVLVSTLEGKSLRQWASDPFAEANVLLDGWKKLSVYDDKRSWSGKIPRLCDAWKNSLDSSPFISV
jgi:hypothetical protein